MFNSTSPAARHLTIVALRDIDHWLGGEAKAGDVLLDVNIVRSNAPRQISYWAEAEWDARVRRNKDLTSTSDFGDLVMDLRVDDEEEPFARATLAAATR